jgi:hypothetical protein
MTGQVRTALSEMAERAPKLPMPPGIYERGRKRQGRQRILGALGVVFLFGLGVGLSAMLPVAVVVPAQPSVIDDMPSRVVNAPKWTASVEEAPLPRALVAFAQRLDGEVTLVGPHDQYRVYATAHDQTRPILSPDGRFLMTGRGLLDVTTGVTRSLDGDVPLGFSADGRLALVARYDAGDVVSGQIRAIDPADGAFVWAVELEPGPMPHDVGVAVAPDGSLTAITRHAELWLYDSGGRLLWKRAMDGELAGQLAFVPERRSLAVVTGERLCLLDTEKGEGGLCYDLSGFSTHSTDAAHEVLGWQEGWPIVNMSRDVVSFQGVPEKLLEGPGELSFLGFASERVRWSQQDPGAPDGGPFFERFLDLFKAAFGVVLIAMYVRALVWLGAWRAAARTRTNL